MNPFRKRNNVNIKAYLFEKNIGTDADLRPWVNQMFPEPISKNIPRWFSKGKSLQKDKDVFNIKTCPSFVNSFKIGHVVKTSTEINVVGIKEPDGTDGWTIRSPLQESFEVHYNDQFLEGFPFPEGMINISFKIISPFNYRTNRPVSVIILPCWWDRNNKNISAIQGIIQLSPEQDTALNINTFIRIPKFLEEYTIPYGTPLAHIIVADIPHTEYTHDQSVLGDKLSKESLVVSQHRVIKGSAKGRDRNVMDDIRNFLIRVKKDED